MTFKKHVLTLLLVVATLTGFAQNKKGDISLSITASPFPTTLSGKHDFGIIAKASPFDITYEDIKITVSGAHSFDNKMGYEAVFDVPANYFGTEVNSLIAKINNDEANNLTIPVTASIGGSFTSPTVSTDLTSGVTNLTKQLVEIQKQKLINQGTNEIKDAIGGLLGGDPKPNNAVKDVLGGLLGGTSKKDSTTTESKNLVKDVLGGFLGGKKKK